MPVVTKDYVKNLLGKVIKSAFPNKSSLNKISESDGRMLFDGNEISGIKGEKGDPFTYDMFTPEQLTKLTGPQGPKGDKGDTGEPGPQGERGYGMEVYDLDNAITVGKWHKSALKRIMLECMHMTSTPNDGTLVTYTFNLLDGTKALMRKAVNVRGYMIGANGGAIQSLPTMNINFTGFMKVNVKPDGNVQITSSAVNFNDAYVCIIVDYYD